MGSLRIAPTWPWKLHLERHTKLKGLLYLQVLEEGGMAGSPMGGAPRKQLNQTGGELRDREDPWAVPFWGVRWSTQAKCMRDFLGPLNVTRSQGSMSRGTGGRDQPHHPGPAGHCPQAVCGDVETSG